MPCDINLRRDESASKYNLFRLDLTTLKATLEHYSSRNVSSYLLKELQAVITISQKWNILIVTWAQIFDSFSFG